MLSKIDEVGPKVIKAKNKAKAKSEPHHWETCEIESKSMSLIEIGTTGWMVHPSKNNPNMNGNGSQSETSKASMTEIAVKVTMIG